MLPSELGPGCTVRRPSRFNRRGPGEATSAVGYILFDEGSLRQNPKTFSDYRLWSYFSVPNLCRNVYSAILTEFADVVRRLGISDEFSGVSSLNTARLAGVVLSCCVSFQEVVWQS